MVAGDTSNSVLVAKDRVKEKRIGKFIFECYSNIGINLHVQALDNVDIKCYFIPTRKFKTEILDHVPLASKITWFSCLRCSNCTQPTAAGIRSATVAA